MRYNHLAMTTQKTHGAERITRKRKRRIALITIVDYLSKLDRPATTTELYEVLKQNGVNITLRSFYRWLQRWCEDKQHTKIKYKYNKKLQRYKYTAYKCADTRSYERIVHMVDRYMGA